MRRMWHEAKAKTHTYTQRAGVEIFIITKENKKNIKCQMNSSNLASQKKNKKENKMEKKGNKKGNRSKQNST